MGRQFILAWIIVLIASAGHCARAADAEAGPTPAPIKMHTKGFLAPGKTGGLKRYASQEELDKAFGAGTMTPNRAVDFAKEDLVCVGWLASPPAPKLKWKSSEKDGITFYLEKRPSKIHGNVVMPRSEWFTVPKGTKAVMAKGGP